MIDLLPERTSDFAAQWLRRHSCIRLVTRDCARPYASAITAALPGAVQVADRWHLSSNLHCALVRQLEHRHREIVAAAEGAMEGVPPFALLRPDFIVAVETGDRLSDLVTQRPTLHIGHRLPA